MSAPRNFVGAKMVKCSVASGEDLVAKDMGGTSDPFCVIGFANEKGAFVGKKYKSAVVKKSLNPFFVWPEDFYEQVTADVTAVLVEVWDADFIGSDDFMGMALIPLSSFVTETTPDFTTRFMDVQLKPRPGKNDRVSGSVKIAFVFHTKEDMAFMEEAKKEAARKKQEELEAQQKIVEENKKRQEEARLKAEQAAKEAAAAEKEEKRKQALAAAEKAANSGLDMELVKKFAEVALDAGVDPTKPITEPNKLFDILLKAGVAHDAMNASYFGMDMSKTMRSQAQYSIEHIQVESERLFKLFDVSGDGKIDYTELLFGLAQIAEGTMEQKAAFFFDAFDKDKNGVLDRKEVAAVLKLIAQRLLASIYVVVMDEFKAKERLALTETEKLGAQLAQITTTKAKAKMDLDALGRTFADMFIAKEGDKLTKVQFIEKTCSEAFQRQMQLFAETMDNKILTEVRKEVNEGVAEIKRRYHTVQQLRVLVETEHRPNKYDFTSALRG